MNYLEHKNQSIEIVEKSKQINKPIGIFDSGVGGLTVLKTLQAILPYEDFLYFGDTARLPYGSKSENTIIHYTRRACHILVQRGVKALIIACNTASSVALPSLIAEYPHLPIIGVIEPGAKAAIQASLNGQIAVLATAATVRAGAYQRIIQALHPQAQVFSKACPLFVALAEEGLEEGKIPEAIAEHYLRPLLKQHQPDTLVLGCTHFPILLKTIQKIVGETTLIVDSAHATADTIKAELIHHRLIQDTPLQKGYCHFLVTDAPKEFQRVATYFLKQSLPDHVLEWVDHVC
jgi:glutamate racemase